MDDFNIALQLRNFEIQQLSNRNTFFMIFQGVLFAGYIQSIGREASSIYFWIALVGLMMGIFQAATAAGAKFWQQRWEAALVRIELNKLEQCAAAGDSQDATMFFLHAESNLHPQDRERYRKASAAFDTSDSLTLDEGYINALVGSSLSGGWANGPVNWLIMRKFSVSRIPIYVGITMSIVWLMILLSTFDLPIKIIVFHSP